jgi:hypothetical protein
MEALVPNWKEFRFKIDGTVGEEQWTPLTMPMARLAEYLADLAAIMGHDESVHFITTDTGSNVSVVYVDEEEESRVTNQIQNSARGAGPRQANAAYKRLDTRLREDNAFGSITNVTKNAQIIEFPGRKAAQSETYGPIREHASIVGVLKRVGGFDDSIPVHLQRADGVIFYCEAAPGLARDLFESRLYEKTIRVHGFATYYRENGLWRMDRFRILSFDPEPLAEENLSQTIEKLRAIPGSEWNEISDPLEELRRLRHGEDIRQ